MVDCTVVVGERMDQGLVGIIIGRLDRRNAELFI